MLAVRWDSLTLPFFWDEVGFYAQFAYSLHEKGFGFTDEWVKPFFIHPPLYYGAMAAATNLFGWKLVVVRLLGLAAAAAYLTVAYRLGRRYLLERTAILTTVALALSPVVLSEAGLMHPDLLAAALALAAVLAALDGRLWACSAWFAAAVAVNAPIASLAPVIAWLVWRVTRGGYRKVGPTFLPPMLLLAAWYAWYAHVNGPGAGEARTDVFLALVPMAKRFAHRGVQILFWDARYALTIAVVCVAALRWRRKKGPVPASELAPLFALVAMTWVFLTAVGFSHQRYFAAALPPLYVAGAWAFERLVPKWAPVALVLLAAAGLQAWHDEPDRFSELEYRARYRELARILTGDATAEAEDGMAWVRALVTDLAIPPLSRYGLSAAEIPAVVAKAEQAASMKGNPVALSADDLTAILAEALG